MTSTPIKFFQRLSTQISLLVGFVGVAMFLSLAAFTISEQAEENRHVVEQEVRTTAQMMQATFDRVVRYERTDLLDEILRQLKQQPNVLAAFIYDRNGDIVFAPEPTWIDAPLYQALRLSPETWQTLNNNTQITLHHVKDQGRLIVYVPLSVSSDYPEFRPYSLMLAFQQGHTWWTVAQSRVTTLAIQFLIVMVLVVLLHRYLNYRITKRLGRMQAGVQAMGEEQQHISIDVRGRDDIAVLARQVEAIAAERHAHWSKLKNLETAVDQSNECIIITNAKGEIEYVNKAFEWITGYQRSELIGNNPRILKSGLTAQSVYRDLWQVLNQGKTWRGELLNRRKDGQVYTVYSIITPVYNDQGECTHYIAVEDDITERKADEQRLHFMAYYETLTGLPNRQHMTQIIEQGLASLEPSELGYLLLVDIDRLQQINDARGHEFGNRLVQCFAKRLKQWSDNRSVQLAHLGADLFAILFPAQNVERDSLKEQLYQTCDALLAVTRKPIELEDDVLTMSASIGAVIYPQKEGNAEQLLRRAETALHKAKRYGGNHFAVYRQQYGDEIKRQFEVERMLRQAIQHDQLELYLQSQVNAAGTVVSAEGLIRWHHPQQGMISPGVFIPIAERSDLILAIDHWVLNRAAQILTSDEIAEHHFDALSVNISARHFLRGNLAQTVSELIETYQFNPSQLMIEVTEGVLIEDTEKVIEVMHQLSRLGVRFSIDDFGTGYSSLAYIQKLPVSELKIDQSFVRGIGEKSTHDALVETILSIGEHLGLRLVAEGVETEREAQFLIERCPTIVMQGYLYGYPTPAQEWLSSFKPNCSTTLSK
ncbi:PAS domain S-box-containing protein/diguanylate cyclase (GGDEF)-like protein [Idiomarina fontislapidosi]|uniref:GGDEF domain-containing protein n=1 Tax=Idiomarina fontislapidosi TaxID=263723 RepID=A0A432Y2M6_9GAMM|nr:GGDEF domain-containing phosphodiesterase [Idiomarina fontislapidosi]PYE33360.1 PAS domain S-box-containing protein/diguanylate cyclase (GGDEF)-like protein [Idiomarina fontislapidosi]RUO55194.1 hypothetical protein CWE25_07395 [Idiomarina fontislapidosi]